MSVVQGVISSGTQTGETIDIEVPTVRVPELSDAETPLEDTDLMLLYKNDPTSKTRKTTLLEFRRYIELGSGAPPQAVSFGAQVEVLVTSENGGGTNTINVPMLAGYEFTLNRQGIGDLQSTEYSILPGGGFKLSAKDANGNVVPDSSPNAIPQIALVGERFTAQVFDLVITGTESGNPGSGTGASEFTGLALIASSTQLSSIHRGKLLHCAFGSNAGVITLEDLTDAPKYSTITIETNISNTKQTRIETKLPAQKIYVAGTSVTYLYLGIAETLKLFVGDDGYYIISNVDFLLRIGQPLFDYKLRANSLVANGQLVLRSDYPRLWDLVQSLDGISLVDDTTWNTVQPNAAAESGTMQSIKPYEGCFSKGDGTTTFRLPNLQGKFFRGLVGISNTGFIPAGEAERLWNQPGGIQKDTNRKHHHSFEYEKNGTDGTPNGKMMYNGDGERNGNGLDDTVIASVGGYESRPINAGLIPLIYV